MITSPKKLLLALAIAVIAVGIVRYFRKPSETIQIIKITQPILAKLQSPEYTFQKAKLLPRFSPQKEVECMEVSQIQPGSVFSEIGIIESDCAEKLRAFANLTQPRDFVLTDPAVVMSLYQELSGVERVDLELQRDGKKIKLRYERE